MKIKRFFQIVIGVIIISAIVGVLFSNKNKLDEKAERSLKGNTEIPVNVSYPQFASVGSDVNITGTIVSENEVLIVSKAQGIVLSKYKKAGEWVTKGMLIAKIEDNVICENLRIAELNFAKASKDVERYHSLVAVDAVTKTEVENVEIAMRNAESVVIELKEQLKKNASNRSVNGCFGKRLF